MRLREEDVKARAEAADFDVLRQSLEVLQTEDTALWDRVAIFLSAAGCARRRNESILVSVRQRIFDVDLLMEREA